MTPYLIKPNASTVTQSSPAQTTATPSTPDTRRDDASGAGHPRHLAEARDRVRHEVDDQLRQRSVEIVVGERQLLGGCAFHTHLGMS